MITPEALRIVFFQTSRRDYFPPGWVHEKTVPHCILAQPLRGAYGLSCAGGEIRARPPQFFLTGPNLPLRIVHEADRQKRFASRWIHFSCVLHHAIDLGDILKMPLLVSGDAARELSLILDELERPATRLDEAAAQRELAWRVIRIVCKISGLKPVAADLLKAGQQMEPLLTHLRLNLAKEISIAEMARFAGMSPSRLHGFFRERLGCGPAAYLKRLRLEAAAALLISSNAPLKQIATETGFANPFHLSREFTRRFDASPKVFRRLNAQA